MLDVSGGMLDSSPGTELLPLLSSSTALTSLNLRNCALDASFSRSLRNALLQWPALATLDLTGAIPHQDDDLAHLAFDWPVPPAPRYAIATPRGLTSLSLSWMPLGGRALAAILLRAPALRVLEARACLADSAAGLDLAEAGRIGSIAAAEVISHLGPRPLRPLKALI